MGFGMGLGWFIPLLLIVGLVYFFNENSRDRKNDEKRLSAKEILDLRLAKGEIDKDEYEQRVKALQS